MARKIKTVFIAHPIKGDVKGNIKKVLGICKKVHSKKIVPVVPYLASLQYLNDDVVEDRELGVLANIECFHRRYIDELWLFGDCISEGMKEEIKLALKINIPIIGKTKNTRSALRKMLLKKFARNSFAHQSKERYLKSLCDENKSEKKKRGGK